jgi:hypothetical protein
MTQAFNLSQLANFVNTSGKLNAATGLFNQTPVANGGTGKSSVTSGALLLGAGTSAMTELTGTTPGTTIVSSPAGWVSSPTAAVGGGDYVMNAYASPATWNKPGTLKAIKVTVVGAGGNGGNNPSAATGGGGGGGGAAICYIDAPAIPGPQPITAGAGTNSFGAICSATAGAVGGAASNFSGSGGAGGVGSGGTFNIQGGGGTAGYNFPAPATPAPIVRAMSGAGGNSIFGGGAQALSQTTSQPVGIAGGNYGGGGGGSIRIAIPGPTVTSGGAGAPGIVIVEEFY